jgi:hypothetical protein
VAEWLKAHAWKVCIRETVSRVRIPLPPPALSMSGPEPWVTDCTEDMGDNLGPNGLSRGLQGFLLQIDEAEIVAHKADVPNAFVHFFDSQALTGKNGRDVDAFATHADASAGRDAEVVAVQRIGEVRQAVIGEGALTSAGRFLPSASWGLSR